jgi:8-oxo-dGTP pyrophosphatase MutT (NUDIX family)
MSNTVQTHSPTPGVLEKVTALVMRPSARGDELLLFRHPYVGIQIPAGTVDPGETPDAAVLRETHEETGLREVSIVGYLGAQEAPPMPGHVVMRERTTVYARPDAISFDWATLPRAAMVRVEREADGWTQVTYMEWDRWPDPTYATYQITGWVANDALTQTQTRHFYRLACHETTPDEWVVEIDNHRFRLFWAPMDDLPEIVETQAGWLKWLRAEDRPDGA